MIAGLSGSMLSHDGLVARGYTGAVDRPALDVHRRLRAWHAEVSRVSGPSWSARMVFDEIAAPFCQALGFDVLPTSVTALCVHGRLLVQARAVATVVASGWGHDPAAAWREAVRAGIGTGTRWCLCFNGPVLRIFDASRTHSRRHAELDVGRVACDPDTFAVTWRLLHADGFKDATADGLSRAVAASENHRGEVRESLQRGVHRALACLTDAFVGARRSRGRRVAARQAFDESLVVVYRVLFLLFAEARGLVPTWHPVFRDSYTIEALRPAVEVRGRTEPVWAALQAIARLAHHGCRAGSLRVPPFNGRLFSPLHAPLADSVPLDEALVREALAALTTRSRADRLERIGYGDLGVEHLGGVYERVLDYDVSTAGGRAELVRGETRKSTGSFYTPRPLTEYLVRRTLAPLVENAGPQEILQLRVLDPAMGSGAFLVAACRYLAHAYELALVRDGVVTHADLTETERAAFRRVVAQRCLYGVDLNPMAVQLARLSLWLATLSADRPLTFFDHHLRVGNSLVGASLDDVRRGSMGGRTRADPLPLFESETIDQDLGTAAAAHTRLRDDPEDTLEHVRAKESLFSRLTSPEGPLATWKRVADLWCAGWFDPNVKRLGRAVFRELLEGEALTETVSSSLLDSAVDAAARERFFHWALEFPEVFAPGEGGFHAIVGNPPWDVVRSTAGAQLTRFSRESGCYRSQSSGHANLYQLFAERALSLLRPGGRIGLVLPAGFAMDHGCARLRRHLLDATRVDTLAIVDNREALFPIHRGLKFALITATSGGTTSVVPCRFGIHAASEFDRLPVSGTDPSAVPVTRGLLERLSGDGLAIPELSGAADATLAARLALAHPAASHPDGWHVRFGRELNATDDRPHFVGPTTGALPIVEGKQIQPFTVDLAASRQFVEPAVARRLLPARGFETARLAYRDVAAATNRLTLIAAVLPPRVVTTHTLFCLRTPLDEDAQHVICALFNSYVANYLVRMRVSTHVTVAIVERLPLPVAARDGPAFQEMLRLARHLAGAPADPIAAATHQALAARLYGLTRDEFAHVLTTFPLIERSERDRALQIFVDRL